MPGRPIRAHLLVPAAIAAVVRFVHLAFLAGRDPLFRLPVVDAAYHAEEARRILDKGWALLGERAFYKGPLLSYVYAVSFSIFGESAGVVAVRVLNIVLGVAAVVLAARVAERLAGIRAAWIAGLTAALYGVAVYFDAGMLQPPLLSVFLLGAAERLLAARDAAAPSRPLVAAGALLGLLSVTRGEGLLAVLLAALWVWRSPPGASARETSRSKRLHGAALVVLPALVVVAPVTVRNAVLVNDPVVISWNGGINLFMGNDPGFDQTSGNWHADLAWMRLFDAPGQLGLSRGAEHQRFFVRQALGAMVRRPLATAALWARKAALLCGGYEISNNRRIYEERERSPVLAVLLWRLPPLYFPFGVVGPLVILGLVLAGRRGIVAAAPVLLLAAATAAAPVVVFNTARYRLPAILLVIPVAAAGWARVAQAPRRARWVIGPAAALACGVLSAVTAPAHPALPPSDELNLADIARREGRADDALQWRQRAVAAEPDDPMARIRLADLLRDTGRTREAIAHYEAVLARRDLAADWINAATRSMARCQFDLGRYAEAADWYGRFLAAEPDRPVTNGRPDFHLRGAPPLLACAMRLERSRALERAGGGAEAVAEAARVLEDCGESEKLARDARGRLAELARAAQSGAAP